MVVAGPVAGFACADIRIVSLICQLAGFSPAFAADCIETLEEIQGEIREAFEHAGGESFTYIPCLNDDAAHMDALAAIVAENLRGWLG